MPTTVAWRGLQLGGSQAHKIESVAGWEELPPARYDKNPRAQGHGGHPSPVWSDERTVTVTGSSYSKDARDDLLRTLKRSLAFTYDEHPLAITLAGQTLTAYAQLTKCSPVVAAGSWNVGLIRWVAEWRCADPLRYAAPVTSTTPLPAKGGGLVYPLAYPLDYGAATITGRVVVGNPGTAPAALLLDARGGLPQGWQVSAAGAQLTYPVEVPSGQTINVDTAAGTVTVDGTASRRGNLTQADWLQVPAADPETGKAGALELQFTSLGGDRDPAALLTATVMPAYW